jgi:hypothetical protein
MAGLKLDAAGQAKLRTLDDALLLLQRINGIVEQYALALKREQPTSVYIQNIRRQLPSLAENVKGHFGTITDLILSVNLSASRGASETMRLRSLREGVQQIKQAIETAMTQTKAKHAVDDTRPDAKPREDAT